MPKYALLTDVMVQGTPRSTGEVLDLSLSDGNLLVGLGRAKSVDEALEPKSEDEVLEPKAEAEALEPKSADAESTAKPLTEPPAKPVVRRRTTSTSTSV